MSNVFGGFRTSLQRREYIKLHTRQHGESCISSKSQLIYGVGSRNWTFHSGTPQNRISFGSGKVQRCLTTISLTTQAQRPGAREATDGTTVTLHRSAGAIATAPLPPGSLQRMVRPRHRHALLPLAAAICCAASFVRTMDGARLRS